MTTSPYGYRVRIGSQFGTGGESPISAPYARRVALNNLCHYADVFGQVRASWASSPRVGGKGYLTPTTPTVVDTPFLIWGTHFPIAVRADGSAYKLRIRIAGASSDGLNAVRFRAVLSPAAYNAAVSTRAEDYVFLTTTTTSSTAAWLTGTSQGADAFTTMVELTSRDVSEAATITSTLSDVGGSERAVAQTLVMLGVYGQTANLAAVPRLHGVYAAEWVGD